MWLKQAIVHKKAALTEMVEQPMASLAADCASRWHDPEALDRILGEHLSQLEHCHLLYALDTHGIQLSSNVSAGGADRARRGQTLAGRPFHTGNLPYRGFLLSPVYVSNISRKHCITAIQAVNSGDRLLGFLAADFNLDDVPLPQAPGEPQSRWTQYKGDPSIRQHVFAQQRQQSALDGSIDQVINTLDTLMRAHGVYHVILHFSSSRAIFWVYDDPYRYRFHSVDEILDPEIWLAYPSQPYPGDAIVAPERIREVLQQFRNLREGDENIYLRSGSLNLMNGIVGLTFSCDGSHYLTVEEFLNREHRFWG